MISPNSRTGFNGVPEEAGVVVSPFNCISNRSRMCRPLNEAAQRCVWDDNTTISESFNSGFGEFKCRDAYYHTEGCQLTCGPRLIIERCAEYRGRSDGLRSWGRSPICRPVHKGRLPRSGLFLAHEPEVIRFGKPRLDCSNRFLQSGNNPLSYGVGVVGGRGGHAALFSSSSVPPQCGRLVPTAAIDTQPRIRRFRVVAQMSRLLKQWASALQDAHDSAPRPGVFEI